MMIEMVIVDAAGNERTTKSMPLDLALPVLVELNGETEASAIETQIQLLGSYTCRPTSSLDDPNDKSSFTLRQKRAS